LQASGKQDLTFRTWLGEVSPTWEWDWEYLKYIRDVLDRVEAGELTRVILCVPPRHGKSEMTTVRWPMYLLEKNPGRRIMVGAYNATLACKFSRKMRRLIKGRVKISSDRKAVDDWETEEGGGVRAVGVGGGVTGMGANIIIIDDPVKSRAEAQSETYRDACYEWYTDDVYTRLEPGGVIVLIMTRWHEDDLAGRILASEDGPNWTEIRLPALAEENDPLGRAPGEALCPQRYDVPALMNILRVMRDSFNALYQQRPSSVEGDIFKADYFSNRYKRLPELKLVATFWDTATKDKAQNDEWAALTVGLGEDGFLYVLRLVHGRWDTPAGEKFLKEQADYFKTRYGAKYAGDYVEDASSGTTLMAYVRKSRPDLALIPVRVEGDKVSRANGVTPLLAAGMFKLPDGASYPASHGWVKDLISQCLAFPNTKHDDIVDVVVYALKWVMGTLNRKKSRRGKGVPVT
jgi:predicted phage terminase large subunit-like protein